MANRVLTNEQKKVNIDLWIIITATVIAFGLYVVFQNQFISIVTNNDIHILLRVLLAATMQFGIAGLGISIVCLMRKESFFSYGLQSSRIILSICLCILCFVPYIIFTIATGNFQSYLPFQLTWTTRSVLESTFPINVIGVMITAAAWGFFEAFNYVVISEKINKLLPVKYFWLNWGAVICAVLCILVHGAIGVTIEGFIEMLSIMMIIYGMLIVKEYTKNSWGCVFIFVFLWNAF